MICASIAAVAVLAYATLHLVARTRCHAKGHTWREEYTDSGVEQTAPRCQRCRQWRDEVAQ
ncbi:MAG: hypothetical protein IPJ65_42940 [Archangiaceae bacterium]|nr:hypothetical protein [Archangiaceae bacterium]MBK7865247.1 hypothetical protein [Archangiaceae bacterium]